MVFFIVYNSFWTVSMKSSISFSALPIFWSLSALIFWICTFSISKSCLWTFVAKSYLSISSSYLSGFKSSILMNSSYWCKSALFSIVSLIPRSSCTSALVYKSSSMSDRLAFRCRALATDYLLAFWPNESLTKSISAFLSIIELRYVKSFCRAHRPRRWLKSLSSSSIF